MQMELGWRQVGPVLPRDWQWHPSTSPFVCLFSLYPSFLSYHSGFFPPCPVLSKLLRLALKTFHVLVSICPSSSYTAFACFLHYGQIGLHTKYTLLFSSPSIFPCCSLFLKCPSLISNPQNTTAILDEASLISPIVPHLPSPHILPFSEFP